MQEDYVRGCQSPIYSADFAVEASMDLSGKGEDNSAIGNEIEIEDIEEKIEHESHDDNGGNVTKKTINV